jgi:hypothetical protein
MFGKTKIIIAFSKDKVIAAKVRGKKIRRSIELGWDEETMDIVLSKIKDALKARTVRVLIGNALSYVLRLTIPSDISYKQERDYIAKKLKEAIPERLRDYEWDYKQVEFGVVKEKEGNGKREVIIFSPVKSFFKSFSSSVSKLGIYVEAIEPEAVAETRDSNPIIGLSLKRDIKGKDEDVLNLTPVDLSRLEEDSDLESEELLTEEAKKLEQSEEKPSEEKPQEETLPKTKSRSRFKFFMLFFLFIVALSLAAIFIYKNFYEDNILMTPTTHDQSGQTQETEEEKGLISSVPVKKEETESKEEISLADYKIQVQNGSGTAGEAQVVSEILAAQGFSDIESSNADSYDYVDTEVRVKSNLDERVYSAIDKALNSDYTVNLSEVNLDEDSEFDAIVIVGERISP